MRFRTLISFVGVFAFVLLWRSGLSRGAVGQLCR